MSEQDAIMLMAVIGQGVMMLLQIFFLITILAGGYSLLKKYRYKQKIKKIDLTKYDVFATKNGLPIIFQNKKNPNELLFV